MATLETTTLHGLQCVRLSLGDLSLLLTSEIGPRILALHWRGGANLFAEVPEGTINRGDGSEPFRFWGGHRFWHAPELPRRTYLPDNGPIAVEQIEDGVIVSAPVEAQTSLQKTLRVVLRAPSQVEVEHRLTNHGLWPIECAAWAITQCRPGGSAILPQRSTPADPYRVLPNRTLVLWPYTDLSSPYLRLGKQYLFISAPEGQEAVKIGWPNSRGWLAYHLDGTLFVKHVPFDPHVTYLDQGASSQCYAGAHFVEVESLGPATLLHPGATVTHTERWSLHELALPELTEGSVHEAVTRLGLDNLA